MSVGRIAGVFYLGTFVTGAVALAAGARMDVANALATFCYIGVTVLFYVLFKPVCARLSLLAALFSSTGCLISFVRAMHVAAIPVNELAFFGCYCVLIGFLIYRSGFLPPALGVLMAIGGVSWLTLAWLPLARSLSPYNYIPGILAEGLLTLWLLVFGASRPTARGLG